MSACDGGANVEGRENWRLSNGDGWAGGWWIHEDGWAIGW